MSGQKFDIEVFVSKNGNMMALERDTFSIYYKDKNDDWQWIITLKEPLSCFEIDQRIQFLREITKQ